MALSGREVEKQVPEEPQRGREQQSWWCLVSFLCFYGFMAQMRPGESFITPYLLGPDKNFTQTQARHQRDHAGAVLLEPGCAGAHLLADRLPLLQAGAAAAGPELRVCVAPAAVWLDGAAHAVHGVLLRHHHGCPHRLLLLHLLAGAPCPLPTHGQLLAGLGAAGRLHQLGAGPAAGHHGQGPLLHAQLHLAGLPHLQPGAGALPEAPQAQPLLQSRSPRACRGGALRAGPDEPGPGAGRRREAGLAAGRLAGLDVRAHAWRAGPRGAAAAAAPLVSLVGLQLRRLLPDRLLRAHPVESGQPHHGHHQGLQRRGRRRLHAARCPHLLRRGLREDPLGAVGQAGHRHGDAAAGWAGVPHVQDRPHLVVLRGLRALPRLLPVPGAHRHFSDRGFSFSRTPRPGLWHQHIPCHRTPDHHHPHRLRQARSGPPGPLSVPHLLGLLPAALRRLLPCCRAGGPAPLRTEPPPAPAAGPGAGESHAREGHAGRSPTPSPGGWCACRVRPRRDLS